MSTDALDTLAGRLSVHPGRAAPLSGSRPVISQAMMQRLTAGLPATLLPQRLASVFSLCGTAHQVTAARAVCAALHDQQGPAELEQEALLLRLWTAREHLQRLAIDLPRAVPVQGVAADPAWLRGWPLQSLPASGLAPTQGLQALRQNLLTWLEQTLFGQPAAEWLAAWQAELSDTTGALQHWCASHDHPVARWLHGVRPLAVTLQLPARPLELLDDGETGLRRLAGQLAADIDFARQPVWQGQPAQTGCWTRQSLPASARRPRDAWGRWLARLAELLHLAMPGPWLQSGALWLGEGQALAWTEMSRGLLLHWVQLQGQGPDARVLGCRVLAPTEWNFHPQGGLAQWLARPGLAASEVAAAVAALDPCVAVDLHAQGAVHA
jgi:hypothetical protein